MAKTIDSTTRQLQMSFDSDNRFRDSLREGAFTVTFEFEPPPLDEPFEVGLLKVGETLESLKGTTFDGIVLKGRADGHPLHRMVEYVRKTKRCRRDVLAMVSLAGRTVESFRSDVAALVSAGVQTIIPATGPALPNHPRDRSGQAQCAPDLYLDSGRLLRLIQDEHPQLFVGALTNPYKYTVADSWLQHLKMLRKLNTGAQFIVTEAGWDMKKLQELQWFMASRGLSEPVVARLRFVEAKSILPMMDHSEPGMVMPSALAARLERDVATDERHARLAQLSRLALQAVGCRLLGYSGVQISGIADMELAPLLLRRIKDALSEFTTYELWLAAWHDAMGNMDLAPHPNRYYLYRDLLTADHPAYNAETTRQHPATLPEPSSSDKVRYQTGERLDLGSRGGGVSAALRKLVCGDLATPDEDATRTMYLGAGSCPKGLTTGPCGGSQPDGTCEFGDRPCLFQRVLALANWSGTVESLETAVDVNGS